MTIKIDIPLEDKNSRLFGAYDLSSYSQQDTRIAIRSDIPLVVNYRWHMLQHDIYDSHLVSSQKVGGHGVYRMDKLNILGRYLTIEVKKGDTSIGKLHDLFYLEIFTTGNSKDVPVKPPRFQPHEPEKREDIEVRETDSVEDFEALDSLDQSLYSGSTVVSEDIQVTETRTKSPFRGSFLKNITNTKRRSVSNEGSSSKKTPKKVGFSPVIPPLILEGSLLCGAKGNTLYALPKAHSEGMYLMSGQNGIPEWKIPYPPRDP